VLKIKVIDLEFEVIPIFNIFYPKHNHLESLSAPPYNNDDFLN